MRLKKVTPDLWHWTEYYPEWGKDVGCTAVRTREGVVLIDPLAPPGDETRLWSLLDRDIGAARSPVHILITVYWHARSTRAAAKRYHASIWAPSRQRAAVARRTGSVTHTFRPGDRLPGGIEAFATARGGEVAFWIPDQRALAIGDVLHGTDGSGLRLCPESWVPARAGLRGLVASLRPLLDLPVERVLVSHGAPVLKRGRTALRRVLTRTFPRRQGP